MTAAGKRQVWWASGIVATLGSAFVAVIGFAHTDPGRPLLPYLTFVLGAPKSCPLGFDQTPTTALFRKSADQYMTANAETKSAASKAVPDFKMGQTTSAEVKQVMSDREGACTTFRSATEFECLHVKTRHGSQSMWLRFNAQDQLANVRGVETIEDARHAAAKYAQLTKLLDRQVGTATQRTGTATIKDLKSGLLYQASSIYTYRDYQAVVRVTNMGENYAITTEFNDPEVLTR